LAFRGHRFRIGNEAAPAVEWGVPLLSDAGAAGAGPAPLLAAHVVDQDVLTQPVRRDEERPPLVDPRHLVDELGQVRPTFEHERVDHNAVARAPFDLTQRLLDRVVGRRIRELGTTVLPPVCRWLSFGDYA